MAEIKSNPMVAKLLEHAAKSKTISYDEISDWLPEELVKSEAMNDIIALLESSGVEITEDVRAVPVGDNDVSAEADDHDEDDADEEAEVILDEDDDLEADIGVGSGLVKGNDAEVVPAASPSVVSDDDDDDDDDEEEEEENEDDAEGIDEKEVIPAPPQRKLVFNDKDSSVDDPIRLYLREIGKENLLTAEQEVTLSKQMEDGENIIKKVLKTSGMIIPEFHDLAQKASSKSDPREMNYSKKEISDFLAERRRINQFYKEALRGLTSPLKQYIDMKIRIAATDGDVITDKKLVVRCQC